MLYTLRKSPWNCDLQSLLPLIREEDDLLLIEDAVYAAISGTENAQRLSQTAAGCYVLYEDLIARGVLSKIDGRFTVINYHRFVQLTVKHTQQVSW